MRKIDHLATEIYTFTDDALKRQPHLAHWRRSNNRRPGFTDAEVLTIALLQPALGLISLKHAYELVRDNLPGAFPRLPSYAQWLARLHALGTLTGHLMQVAARRALSEEPDRLYVLDSKPIPVCTAIRHGRVRLLRDEGAYFGKTSAGWFFGFKLHVIAHQSGVVLSAVLTPGNWGDRTAALALGWETGGRPAGDRRWGSFGRCGLQRGGDFRCAVGGVVVGARDALGCGSSQGDAAHVHQ